MQKNPSRWAGAGGKHPGRCLAQGSWIKTQVWSPESRREGLRPPRVRMSTASGLIFSIWLKH